MQNTLVPTSLAFGAALAIAISTPVLAEPSSVDVTSEIDWSGHISDGTTVTIYNPRGAIVVRRSDDGSASLRANVTQPNWLPDDKTSVAATQHGNDVVLCTTLADAVTTCDGSNDAANERAAAASQTRVDEVVAVPRGVRVIARGIEGRIVVEGAPASVDATTVNGDIHVAAAGTVTAATRNGSIYASLARPSGEFAPMVFRSKNGSISIDAPKSANFAIKASAPNGKVSADLPVVASVDDARGAFIDAQADFGSILVTTH